MALTPRPTAGATAPRRLLVAAFFGLQILVVPVGLAYVGTHIARAVVPANHLGVPYENVKFETKDGLKLEGWYIPSRNGAAVISFPGRKGPQRQARMLARHGYGVLLFDRRGEGRSDGEPNIFGWGGDEDIKAAVRYLQTRDDVDPKRIGGIGLSVGGELMLEAAAETKDLARGRLRRRRRPHGAARPSTPRARRPRTNAAQRHQLRAQGRDDDDRHRPARRRKHLKTLVGEDRPAPAAADRRPRERRTARSSTASTTRPRSEPKALWEIPDAGHVNGIATRPAEYERRVVGFFDQAL